jgi:hypothetical protein
MKIEKFVVEMKLQMFLHFVCIGFAMALVFQDPPSDLRSFFQETFVAFACLALATFAVLETNKVYILTLPIFVLVIARNCVWIVSVGIAKFFMQNQNATVRR